MRKTHLIAGTALASILLFSPSVYAASSDDIALMRQEIESLRTSSERRIKELEAKVAAMEEKKEPSAGTASPAPAAPKASPASAFNPAISAVLQGGFNSYSQNPDGAKITGFTLGEEAGLPNKGFSLGESEITLSANVDQMFYGALTAALEDDAGTTEIAVEEAFVETLALPYGTKVKAGRMFPVLGYLNEIHAHADSFVDRPLPTRAFLGADNYRDDGAQVSVILPTDCFSEIGGGAYRGIGFPAAGSSSSGTGAQNLFARVGGDIGASHAWLAGLSYLRAEADERATDGLVFNGDTDLYIADLKYTWSPNGNPKSTSVSLQGEYFWREENGDYNAVDYSESSSGWYAQAVYKFLPQWKAGYRIASLNAADVPLALDTTDLNSNGHNPFAQSVLLQFNVSEFSNIRLQYSRDDADQEPNDQLFLRYTMSLGAHGAHRY